MEVKYNFSPLLDMIRSEQIEFYRDCPDDPNTSSYYCLGAWQEKSRKAVAQISTKKLILKYYLQLP